MVGGEAAQADNLRANGNWHSENNSMASPAVLAQLANAAHNAGALIRVGQAVLHGATFLHAAAHAARAKALPANPEQAHLLGFKLPFQGTTTREQGSLIMAPKRKRRSRRSGRTKKRRRTVRRRNQRKRRKRTRRSKLSTRLLPTSMRISFPFLAQVFITTRPGGWGIVRLPVNNMERPLGLLKTLNQNFYRLATSVGEDRRQPDGMDRWIGTTTQEGKYLEYRVDSCNITITHIPCTAADDGLNLVGGIQKYVGEPETYPATGISSDYSPQDAEEYRNYPRTDLAPVLVSRKSPFQQVKVFNTGKIGQTWKFTWNRNTFYRKYPHRRPSSDSSTLFLTDFGSETFLEESTFMLGQLGPSSAGAHVGEFLLSMKYNCTCLKPTSWLESTDVSGGAGIFMDT